MNVDDVLSQPMSWSRESSLYFLKGYLGKIVLLKDTDTQMKLLGKLIEIEEIFLCERILTQAVIQPEGFSSPIEVLFHESQLVIHVMHQGIDHELNLFIPYPVFYSQLSITVM